MSRCHPDGIASLVWQFIQLLGFAVTLFPINNETVPKRKEINISLLITEPPANMIFLFCLKVTINK
jgi:hypothetical protein